MSLILDGTSGLSDVDGTAAAPAIRGTDTNTGIFFPAADTIAFSEGGVESMRIDASGNVGIGTSSPAARLEAVAGTGSQAIGLFRTGDATAANNSGGGFNATSSATAGSRNARLWLDADGANFGGSDYFYIDKAGNSGDVAIIQQSNAAMTFQTNGAERARIDSSGNLMVGTTSPIGTSGKFCIVSTGGAINDFYVTKPSVNQYYNAALFLNNAGSNVGYIQCSTTGTTYSTSSDYRLKDTIAPMTGALAKVAALKPCTYKWKVDGSDGQGFIAHELAEVEAGCVTGEKDAVDAEGNPQYQGIDTSFLVATLAAAIQEQQAMLAAQDISINALNERLTALEGTAA